MQLRRRLRKLLVTRRKLNALIYVIGKAAGDINIFSIRKAFEDTYASIQDETYIISDVKWIAVDQQVSVCMYQFRSNGLVNRKRQVHAGKGTNVLKRINDNWQIIHEHLSKEKE